MSKARLPFAVAGTGGLALAAVLVGMNFVTREKKVQTRIARLYSTGEPDRFDVLVTGALRDLPD